MNEQYFQSSAWYHGMTLGERIRSFSVTSNNKLSWQIDSELAKKRMESWRKQSPFTDDSFFAQRLDLDEITEDEFFYIQICVDH